jgi:hypothetical protein
VEAADRVIDKLRQAGAVQDGVAPPEITEEMVTRGLDGPYSAEPNLDDDRWTVTLSNDDEVQFYGTEDECKAVRDTLNRLRRDRT